MKRALLSFILFATFILPFTATTPAHAASCTDTATINVTSTIDVKGIGSSDCDATANQQIWVDVFIYNANTGQQKAFAQKTCNFGLTHCSTNVTYQCNANGQMYYAYSETILYSQTGNQLASDVDLSVTKTCS